MNSIYDLTEEQLVEIVQQGADNNIIIYDMDSKILSERLIFLIHNCFANVFDTSYTHLIIPPNADISAIIDVKPSLSIKTRNLNNDIIGIETVSGKTLVSYDCYNKYLNYFIEKGYTLANDDSNLVIIVNAKKLQRNLKKSILLASF